jgi:hypothetical protein
MRTASSVASSSNRRVARVWLWPALVIWLVWAWGLVPRSLARDYPLEIIELRSRLPEELIPILEPLVGPDGTIVGAQHALFVRASPDRLADIRRALAELDRPARSLLIQVWQGSNRHASGGRLGARVDETWRSGDTRGRVRIGPPGPTGTQVIASAGGGRARRDLTQEVRALDGHPTYISIGYEQPMPYRELEAHPGGALVRQGQEYWRVESGFTVIPRVLGDRVILEIGARSATPAGRGAVETGILSSRIEGRIGDWIPIGAGRDSGRARSGGLLFGAEGRREIQGEVELRVLPLD